ncbi:MAG: protein-glutamate O-methyltransferase CheR [Pseudomonadota bacterium]
MQAKRASIRPVKASLSLSSAELNEFATFFYGHTGIKFADAKMSMLQTQVSNKFGQLGFTSFREAMEHLKSPRGAVQLQEVVNALTINETYFYREKYQFDVLAKQLLPERTQSMRSGGKLKIWCLPCSTGEEPYSVAIYLRENWPGFHIYNVEICGSDIDTEVLKTAVRGQYNSRSLSRMPKELHTKYFKPTSDGSRFALNRDVADTVKFNQINLLDRRMTSTMSGMDVIFCRNVLIYLDDTARRTAVKNLYDNLKPGGCLMLGHAESMSWLSTMFNVERKGGAVLYRKK